MIKFVFAAIAAVTLCAPAVGQATAGTQLQTAAPAPRVIEGVDGAPRATMACLARREGARGRTLLQSAPGSPAEARLLTSFQSRLDECLAGPEAVGLTGHLLRGFVAEALYNQDVPAGLGAAPRLDTATATAWAEPRVGSGGDQQIELLHAAARCVVAADPASVSALLDTAAAGARERSALKPISGLLGPCLPAGLKFTASRQALRGLLAEAALQYSIGLRDGFKAPTAMAEKK